MRLLQLSIENFGVFRGVHDFPLTPPPRRGRPPRTSIVVFRGHNGAGKSTLFSAFSLALHGSLALGSRVSRQAYEDYIANRLHRHAVKGSPVQTTSGKVALSFEHVVSGVRQRVDVERRWERTEKGSIREHLDVQCDGVSIDVEKEEERQAWLNDIIPPTVAPFYFFDAEHLKALANQDEHNQTLSDLLRLLLGLDLVERLIADLEFYVMQRGGRGKTKRLADEVKEKQSAVDYQQGQLDGRLNEAALMDERAHEIQATLAELERKLASEGGSYAARRQMVKGRQRDVENEIEKLSDELREMCNGLLPFALAPELCRKLSRRLTEESHQHKLKVAGDLWEEQTQTLRAALKKDVWQGLDVPTSVRTTVTKRLSELMTTSVGAGNDTVLIHQLTEQDTEQLQGWINQSLHSVPTQVKAIGKRLRELRDEAKNLKQESERAPEEEFLMPIREQIAQLEEEHRTLQRGREELEEKIKKHQFEFAVHERDRQKAVAEFQEAIRDDRQLKLATTSQAALRAYEDAMFGQRLDMLAIAVAEAFNAVCRKDQFLSGIYYDRETFTARFTKADGHELMLSELSVGEQQLYAMAVLQALRQVAKRETALVIDMPLARLDETHRERMIHQYLPNTTTQAILFTTGSELNDALLAEAGSSVARYYKLEFDQKRGETVVTEGGW